MKGTKIEAESRWIGPTKICSPGDIGPPNYAQVSYIVVSLTFRLSKSRISS